MEPGFLIPQFNILVVQPKKQIMGGFLAVLECISSLVDMSAFALMAVKLWVGDEGNKMTKIEISLADTYSNKREM